MKIHNIIIAAFIGIFHWSSAFGDDIHIDMEELAGKIESSPAYERARQLTEKIEEKLNRRVQAKVAENRAAIEALEKRIYRDIAADPANRSTTGPDQTLFGEKERIFIFVSRSVPLDILKSYAAGIKALRDSTVQFVFRAFPKNFLDSMLRKSPECSTDDCVVRTRIIISKRLFKRYGINYVPAVVHDPNPSDKTHADWLKVSGAASLEEILNLFYRETGKETFKIAAKHVARK